MIVLAPDIAVLTLYNALQTIIGLTQTDRHTERQTDRHTDKEKWKVPPTILMFIFLFISFLSNIQTQNIETNRHTDIQSKKVS